MGKRNGFTLIELLAVIVIKNSSSVSGVPKYTVTFETNGGSAVSSQTVYEGGKATNKSTSKSGYTFNGWYTNSNLTGSTYNFNTPVTSDLILYAKFTRNTPTPTPTTTTTTTKSRVQMLHDCCAGLANSYCSSYGSSS